MQFQCFYGVQNGVHESYHHNAVKVDEEVNDEQIAYTPQSDNKLS